MAGKIELLAPAGSAEGVAAAVQSGADAVYLSFSSSSKREKYELSEDELGRACEFARVRGVKVYVSLDFPSSDDWLAPALENARRACRMGADALIVNDMGFIWALRRALPSMPLHAGEALGIHDADGVRLCAAMGVKRVAVARELSLDALTALCKDAPIEIEYAVHGPLCPPFAGQCLLPALHGYGAGPCPHWCLKDFPAGVKGKHPLGMKDNCLLEHLEALAEAGAAALRIDGRERRPEYAAAVTGVYSRALGTGRRPPREDLELLEGSFPAAGFTDGYLTGGDFTGMMGTAGREPEGDTPFYAAVRKNYLNHEFQRVKVTFDVDLRLEQPVKLTATDQDGNTASAEGGQPELAFHTETTPAMLRTELYNTGGTPFVCDGVTCRIQKGIYLDPRELAPARDRLLAELLQKRRGFEPRAESDALELPPYPSPTEPPVLTVSVLKCAQLSQRLLELAPPVIYLPLEEAASGDRRLEPFLSDRRISVCAQLPPVIYDSELGRITELALKARQLGVEEAAVSNLGHIVFARRLGFTVRGDTALNVRNSAALAVLLSLKMRSAVLAMDLSAVRVRGMKKYLDTELVVYGRMPLMHTAGCLIRAKTGVCACDGAVSFPDGQGFECPVTRGFQCRSTLWSSQKLHLIGRSREYMNAGLWGVRLCFTTENADECARICERYLELGSYEPVTTTEGKF